MSATWSNNPNAPRIPRELYSLEKSNFAGYVIGAILHGIVIALFFQCMTALLCPTKRMTEGNKWGLIAHTVALFSVATVCNAIGLFLLPVAYTNGREFPGVDDLPSGPFGYLMLPKLVVVETISNSAIQVNQWLVDGLMLYRCYVIYGMNYWAITVPFMIYLASLATGIAIVYAETLPHSGVRNWGDAYCSIALSLNALLTLMLITRLVLHSKNIRRAMGYQDGASGLYKATITTLIESGALYAASFVLLVGPWASGSVVQYITFQITPEIQCIAPFLIVLRVANRTALTSEAIVSGTTGSIRFSSQGESADGGGTISNGSPIHSASNAHGEAPGKHEAGAENVIEEIPLWQGQRFRETLKTRGLVTSSSISYPQSPFG